MADIGNSLYLLNGAVEILATGEGEIKDRLQRAYNQKVSYIRDVALPDQLRPLLASIRKRLTREPTYKGQGTTASALYRMHRKTAAKIAGDIVELWRCAHNN